MKSISICKQIFQNYLSSSVFGIYKILTLNQYRNFAMANSLTNFEVLPSPIKSESDKKEYKVIKLQNELIACIISDNSGIPVENITSTESDTEESESSLAYSSSSEGSDSESQSEVGGESEVSDVEVKKSVIDQKMAAAALCIGVGSFSDPKEVPGMAHFLEHMVFMGSEKYPTENDFDSFIKKGGGNSNASTDCETTTFYFECLEKHLPEALDKFSQFFIAPLMKKGAMTREREAIDSEFQMALPSDTSRKEQLLFTLAEPNTPVNSFGWGNLKTLKENISDDKLYEWVHQFRKRHYSAHRMTLAIQARLPLEVLQNLVLENFSNVPNNQLRKEDFSIYAEGIFGTPLFNKIYYIKPVKELIKVDLNWSLPSLQHKYKSKPMHYVAYLLGDEGKGSLLSYLKKRMWAISATAGCEENGSEHNSMYAIFNVALVLTEEGLKHLPKVIEAVFSYINLIKQVGPQRRIYDEIKLISDTAFRFATEESPADKVEELCESMQLYPSEDYMAGSELYFEYDPKGITNVVDYLVPENLNVMVTTRNLPDGLKFDRVEKWFGTEYVDVAITEVKKTEWRKVEPYDELKIPSMNQYLANNFAILPDLHKIPDYPEKISETPSYELWYRKDKKFKLPMVIYYFYLISPETVTSAKNYAMTDMFMNLLTFAIAEEAYAATVANLTHTFSMGEKGIIIKVWGFNEKIPKLIELIAKYISNLDDFITEDLFNAVKETVQKHSFNRLLKPSSLAKDLRLKLLINNYWTPVDRYTELLALEYNHMKNFVKEYTQCMFLKVLVQGNVLPEVAINTVNSFVNTLNYKPLPKENYPKYLIAEIPKGERCLIAESFNQSDSNSITSNYYQIGSFTLKDNAFIDIIMLIIEEPLYDILRTKEQLGYHVYCMARDTYGVLGYSITVNSQVGKYSTQYLDSRIKEFLIYSQQLLEDMNEIDLDQIKEDLIKTKEISDVHLKEEVDRNWYEIVNDEYMFDRIKKEIETIKTINLEELKSWWSTHNHFGTREKFRKISIQIVGHSLENNAQTTDVSNGKPVKLKLLQEKLTKDSNSEYFIKHIDNFRANLPLYPVRVIK